VNGAQLLTARRVSAADHVITYTPIQTHTQRQTYRTKQIKSLTDRHALVNAPTNTRDTDSHTQQHTSKDRAIPTYTQT